MSSITAPSDMLGRSDARNRTGPLADVLWVITLYYNGIPIQHNNRVYQIGRHKPPELQDLLGCSDSDWESTYKLVYKRLEAEGHLNRSGGNAPTILRRKVPWAPSDAMLDLASDFFGDHIEEMILKRTYNPTKGHKGDNFELLTHRTIVEHASSYFHKYNWEYREYYDGLELPKVDLFAFDPHREHPPMVVEVITDHNDNDMILDKYDIFEQENFYYLWVFETREQAAEALTDLCWNSRFRANNAPYPNAENYSISRLNENIKKVTRADSDNYGINEIETLTTLHNKLEGWTTKGPLRHYDNKKMIGHPNTSISPFTPVTMDYMTSNGRLQRR